MPEVDPLLAFHLPKRFCTVVRPVIYEVVPSVEMLVVREDQPLVGGCAEVPLHPLQLVGPGARVLPWRRREDVRIEELAQLVIRLDRARHRLHEGEEAWDLVGALFVLLEQGGVTGCHS